MSREINGFQRGKRRKLLEFTLRIVKRKIDNVEKRGTRVRNMDI